jgi:hypothetical protein
VHAGCSIHGDSGPPHIHVYTSNLSYCESAASEIMTMLGFIDRKMLEQKQAFGVSHSDQYAAIS